LAVSGRIYIPLHNIAKKQPKSITWNATFFQKKCIFLPNRHKVCGMHESSRRPITLFQLEALAPTPHMPTRRDDARITSVRYFSWQVVVINWYFE
jgi:hypothetical protein